MRLRSKVKVMLFKKKIEWLLLLLGNYMFAKDFAISLSKICNKKDQI